MAANDQWTLELDSNAVATYSHKQPTRPIDVTGTMVIREFDQRVPRDETIVLMAIPIEDLPEGRRMTYHVEDLAQSRKLIHPPFWAARALMFLPQTSLPSSFSVVMHTPAETPRRRGRGYDERVIGLALNGAREYVTGVRIDSNDREWFEGRTFIYQIPR